MTKFIKFTVEQMTGVYLHLSLHSTYTLNYFLHKNLIGYYMNINIINLNITFSLMRGAINLFYYFMYQWRWRTVLLMPSLVLKLQLIRILNALKISYMTGKWLGGYLTNFKKVFLIGNINKINSWFKFMPKFCAIIGSINIVGIETILKESRKLSLFTFLFSDGYVETTTKGENFTYLIPVGAKLFKPRLFLLRLFVELYRKLYAARSRFFWTRVKRYIKKGRRKIGYYSQHIENRKIHFAKLFSSLSNLISRKYFTSKNSFKLKNRIKLYRGTQLQNKTCLFYGTQNVYLSIYGGKKVVKLQKLALNTSSSRKFIMTMLGLAAKEESIRSNYWSIVDRRKGSRAIIKPRNKSLFVSLLLVRTQPIRQKWLWVRGKLHKKSNFKVKKILNLARRNYILDKEHDYVFNRLFTVDFCSRIRLVNKMVIRYRLTNKNWALKLAKEKKKQIAELPQKQDEKKKDLTWEDIDWEASQKFKYNKYKKNKSWNSNWRGGSQKFKYNKYKKNKSWNSNWHE